MLPLTLERLTALAADMQMQKHIVCCLTSSAATAFARLHPK